MLFRSAAQPPLLQTPQYSAPHTQSVQHFASPLSSSVHLTPEDQQAFALFRSFQQFQLMDTSFMGHASSAQVDPSASVSGISYPLWLLDSGVSLHMTPDATHLTRCRPAPHITRVRIIDGTPLPISFIGHLTTGSFSVPSVFHVPRLSINLKSV